MPGLPIFVSVDGAQKYRDLAKRLKAAGPEGKELRRELNKEIRRAGGDAVGAVKGALQALPAKGSRGSGTRQRAEFASARAKTEQGKLAIYRRSGLRRRIASAITIRTTSVGIRIIVDGRKLPPDQRSLPRLLDNPKGWRKPLFGDREHWYPQEGRPWWYVTLKPRAADFRQGVRRAMKKIERRISQ